MASDIDEIYFEIDEDVGARGEPRLYERPIRVVTTAHPFSADDLHAFAASGEHPGID